MNFRDTFLELTEFTTPYKTETDLEDFLIARIPELQKDQIGNYHKIIGTSDTIFTCHLDNYCDKKEKVNHVINNNIIATDETTVLGGDNKAGVLVLLFLIENNVPGHYCFFIGEESAVSGGGCYGSGMFAHNYTEMIGTKKRAIAFDRRATGSIITRQAAQACCSDEFALHLAGLFAEQGMEMNLDPTGYYTDTSSFMEIIPECTNISAGVYNEHTFKEYIDIEYTEAVAVAAAKIDWESLPYHREPKWWLDEGKVPEKTAKYSEFDAGLFSIVRAYLGAFSFMCMNRTPFNVGKTMTFNHWFKEFKLEVIVTNGVATINGNIIGINLNNKKNPINQKELKKILKLCKTNLDEEKTEKV